MPIFVTAIFMIRKQALTASLGLLIVPNNYFYNIHYLLYILINLLIYMFLCLYRLCYTLLSFLFFVTLRALYWPHTSPQLQAHSDSGPTPLLCYIIWIWIDRIIF